jgi:hypothetical protein
MSPSANPPQQHPPSAPLRIGRVELDGVRRWFRNVFTQDRVAGSLKTLAWVVPLTCLIWVYAEREQVYKTPDPVPIPITLSSSDPKMVVTLVRPPEGMIMAYLEGPRSQVDAVKQQLSGSAGVEAVNIIVDAVSRGQRELSTSAAIEKNPLFNLRGVNVSNCQPPALQIVVDEYEDRELPVAAPPSITNLVAPPIFEPPRVKVRAPKLAWQRATGEGMLQAYADLAAYAGLNNAGPHEIAAARIFVPALQDDPHATIIPGTVKATIEVRQADRQLKIPSMIVYPLGAQSLQKRYKVECPDTIQNVTVIGPPDQIALLERPDYEPKPKAILDLNSDDTTGLTRRKKLRFIDFPSERVRVSPEDAQREVEFKLVPITTDQ